MQEAIASICLGARRTRAGPGSEGATICMESVIIHGILKNVRNGAMSVAVAERRLDVVVHPKTLAVDVDATARLRGKGIIKGKAKKDPCKC